VVVPIGARVYCEGELWGRLTQVVLDRLTNEVTHLVVHREGLSTAGRKVPIEWLSMSTPNRLVLRCSRAELAKSSYMEGQFTSYAPSRAEWSHAGSSSELAIGQGTWVEVSDLYAGMVDELIIDLDAQTVTHVVLQEIHPWGNRRIIVPVSEISSL
jgi:sporulation protein YlmC with PRC-barrel domain